MFTLQLGHHAARTHEVLSSFRMIWCVRGKQQNLSRTSKADTRDVHSEYDAIYGNAGDSIPPQ
jgi:hypothetical protein